MTRPDPNQVTRVGVVGAGVIGGGWAAHFLGRGYDVVAYDPAPDAGDRLRRIVDGAWPALEDLGLAEGASPDRLRIADSMAEACADVPFVQESGPERLDLKQRLLADLDSVAPADTIIGSSTSGYGMSEMQRACARPERTVVGHPFNPPYLVPLVEVVGGQKTDPEAVTWASAFYTAAGKSVIEMDVELSGFLANRLQEAVWREALHMVANNEATVEQIDQAMTEGPGPRWAFMGPCLTFHLAGGEGGMAHMLDHFGPSLESPWTRLLAPELTTELRDRMVEGCEREADGRSTAELIAERDRKLIAVLRAREAV
ncbi:carnitine 3-dehydrogenase [Limimonas halophila]|uniref:Carnitine 3-dehydrogenase n=1 Tax=Limimonas halophila TaxID=1082479 RepID=A0A1G7Q356_9PROT|nr:3-hydroxyacyl-CoA dehydrogenase NAD-binding domain-containing protein [Limimonas halophila]SDF93027.1 carnitine 3-dehydrogenase [Limimonas halophila]